jgi:peroxiredoxin 2/4
MSTATSTATETRPEVTIAKVGQPAPDFNLPSTKNMETLAENISLSDYKGKWLILLFYPLDFHVRVPDRIDGFFGSAR